MSLKIAVFEEQIENIFVPTDKVIEIKEIIKRIKERRLFSWIYFN